MTYITETKRAGRYPITLVHLVMGYCGNLFGDFFTSGGNCQATIPPALRKCMNVFNTCPDQVNFNDITKTYKFCTPTINVPAGYLPLLTSDPKEDSTIITPGKGLGKRATIKCSFTDTKWADYGLDQYLNERPWDSFHRATFWKKWRERNIYFENQQMIVYRGYIEEDGSFNINNFKATYYVISKFQGPDSRGQVLIEGSDEIQLLDKSKVKLPVQSQGKILEWNIGTGTGDFTLIPVGIGDLEYDASGRIAIGEEIMLYTRVADVITVTQRGVDGTAVDEPKADDLVQQCIRYDEANPSDVLYDLIVTRGGIDSSKVDKVAWDLEVADWLGSFRVTNTLYKPQGVNDLLKNLTVQTMTYVWQDISTQMIEMRVLAPVLDGTGIKTLTEGLNIKEGSFRVKYLTSDRISDITVHFDLRNFTEDRDEFANYDNGFRKVDSIAESSNAHKKKAIKEIFGEWIPANGIGQATVVGSRLLDKNVDPPLLIEFAMDKKDDEVNVGDIVDILSDEIIDETGDPELTRFQILSKNEIRQGTTNVYKAEQFQFASRYGVITPDTFEGNPFPDYIVSNETLRNRYMYVCQNDGLYSNGDEGKVII